MEEPSRLKEESESVIVESQQSNSSLALKKPDDDGANLQAPELNPQPIQIFKDSIAQREEKRLADQDFLTLYKSDEKRQRLRFGIVLSLLIACFGFGVPKFFEYTDHARKVSAHFVPAVGSAMIGEKDAAYFQTANFPLSIDDSHTAPLLNARLKILDHSIAELEGAGRSAIFSRLGAEQLLMRSGERKKALKYGDYLIEKYPGLASNYFFRAHVDFETGNFGQAVKEYEQFLALLVNSSPKEQKAWAPQLRESVWACINSGQTEKARMFLRAYEEYGGIDPDEDLVISARGDNYYDLNQAILLAQYDQLDIAELRKTSFFNPGLERYSSELLKKAQVAPDSSPYYFDSILASLEMNVRAGDFVQARAALRDLNRYNFHKYLATIGAAEVALGAGDPNVAIGVLSKYNSIYPTTAQASLLLATAYQQIHSTDLGLKSVDAGLAEYKQFSTESSSGKFYLPLVMMKARLFFDTNQLAKASQLCDELLAANPQLVAPRLLQIQIMEKQNKPREKIDQLRAELSAHLKKIQTW